MDNEEKKEKTAPKKKTMPKKEEPKKVVAKKVKAESTDKSGKRKSQTKTSSKKTTTKKKTVTKKEPTKKVNVPMESTKDANQKEKIKEQRVITNESKSSKVSPELLEIRRKRHLIEAIIIAILVFIVLILLSNRTFLGVIYKNDHINISYFVQKLFF